MLDSSRSLLLDCCRHQFELPPRPIYLNGASRSPLLRSVRIEGQRAVAEKSLPWTIPESAGMVDDVRSMYASLLGVRGVDVALASSTCSALSNIARHLRLEPDEDVLVLEAQNHSNVMPWQDLVARHPGSRLLVVPRPRDFDWTSAVIAAIDGADAHGRFVRVVAVPQNHWSDGSMLDLTKIGQRCRATGASMLERVRQSALRTRRVFVLDLTQSIGVIPFSNDAADEDGVGADFIACSVHKWLMGPYGFCLLYAAPAWTSVASADDEDVSSSAEGEGGGAATATAAAAAAAAAAAPSDTAIAPQDHHDRNRQPPAGASEAERNAFFHDGGEMLGVGGCRGYTTTFLPGARRLDGGGRPNPIGLPMLHAALTVLTTEWLVEDSAAVAQYCEPRTRIIADLARELGFRVPQWHAPHIVGLRAAPAAGGGEEDGEGAGLAGAAMAEVHEWLKTKEEISVSLRMGAIRVCVHVYNTDEEVEFFCDALRRAVEGVRSSFQG